MNTHALLALSGRSLMPAFAGCYAEAAFTLEVAQPQRVTVALFDLPGRRVAIVHDGAVPAGAPLRLRLDGASLPGGTHLLSATGASFSETRRVVLHR